MQDTYKPIYENRMHIRENDLDLIHYLKIREKYQSIITEHRTLNTLRVNSGLQVTQTFLSVELSSVTPIANCPPRIIKASQACTILKKKKHDIHKILLTKENNG